MRISEKVGELKFPKPSIILPVWLTKIALFNKDTTHSLLAFSKSTNANWLFAWTPMILCTWNTISLNGCIDTSECIPVNLSEINDFKNNFVSVYPNPVSEILVIKGLKKLTELESIEIISSKGNVLKKLEEKKEIITIKKLPPGFYFLKINLKTEARTIKFIKN